MKMKTTSTTLAALASLGLAATSANAAITVTADHIQGTPTHTVQSTLLAIDVPTGTQTGPAGPNWADDADDGFSLPSGSSSTDLGRVGWEPDGTSISPSGQGFLQKDMSATYTFDLADGTVVHNVYSTWGFQGNSGSGHTYTDDEGSSTYTRVAAASTNNLILQWTDSASDTHDANFERIFAGDITVTGGNGYVVTFTAADTTSFPFVDAVVIDYTPVPEPTTTALLGLGGLALILRRRK